MRFTSSLALVAAASLVSAHAEFAESANEDVVDASEEVHVKAPEVTHVFKKTALKAPFLDQFIEASNFGKWIPSAAKKVLSKAEAAAAGDDDDLLLQYRGQWSVEGPAGGDIIEGDYGLVLKTLAAHSAISAKFDKPVDPTGKAFVVQYEAKFQNGLECGGAYVKLLTHDSKFEAAKFEDKTPYTVMFGPDKCGGNNKVHFIFRHQNPITKEITEKHLTSPPAAITDKKTNLYTLIVRPDQSFEILINNASVKKGSLLVDFEPAVNPPKEVDDVEDLKPEDWVDEQKMVDPTAVKPEEWDEDAPVEIVDDEAVQPEDWLVDAPAVIPDSTVVKPEDWDDEEDGDWTAPTIPNPACAEASGCGPWSPPVIRNPAYKGKWTAPLIDNPEWKGVWAPRKVENPEYFEDLHPSNFLKMGAIGFELWSMQDGFLFDNIYVGHSEADAKALAQESWAIKKEIEKAREPVVPEGGKDEAGADSTLVGRAKGLVKTATDLVQDTLAQMKDFVSLAQEDFVQAVKEMPQIAGLLVLLFILPLLFLNFIFSGPTSSAPVKKAGGKASAVKASPKKVTKKAAKEEEDEDEDDEEVDEKPTAVKRSVKKD